METFKEKYASLMLIRERTRTELKAIHQIETMLQRCDKQEIHDLFLLQIVMKEERELIQELAHTSDSHFETAHSKFLDLQEKDIEPFVTALNKGKFAGVRDGKSLAEAENKRMNELLKNVKIRRKALESSVQAKNIEKLVDLMTIMGDGKVQIMGNITDLEEGLKLIGLTEQEYQQYVSHQEDDSFNKDIIKALKLEHNLVGNPTEEMNKLVMQSFDHSLKAITGDLLKENEEKKRNQIIGVEGEYFDQMDDFEEKSDMKVEQAFHNLLLRDDPEAPEQDYEAIQKYNKYVFQDAGFTASDTEAEEQERRKLSDNDEAVQDEDYLKEQAYYGMVEASLDSITGVLDDRRQASLEKALNVFNKIQDMHLSSTKKLNLQRNPQTFSVAEIDLIEEQTQQNAFKLYPEDKKFLDLNSSITIDQLADTEGHKLALDSAIATQLHQKRLTEGFSVANPQLINQTIEKMDHLLNDKSSPILRNFMDQLNR